MKKYILPIAILCFLAVIVLQRIKMNRLNEVNQLQSIELSTLNDSVKVYQNKAGELTYKLSAVEISRSNLKESLDKAGFEIKKLKENDINWRKVNNALKLQLESAGHGEAPVIDSFYVMKTDTVKYGAFNWTNNYLSLKGSLQQERLFFDYTYKTGISIIPETKRKETIVSVFMTDPNASITSANSITVQHKTKWFQKWWFWGIVGVGTGIVISK